jgi:hypothetical protein
MKSLTSQLGILFVFVLTFASIPALDAQNLELKECSPSAVYRYSYRLDGKPACKIIVDRFSPGSPLPVQVPPGTNVIVVVTNQRPHEVIQAVTTNDAVAVPDIAGGILGKLASPLGSLVFSPAVRNAPFVVGNPNPGATRQDVLIALKQSQEAAYEVLTRIYGGYIAPTCLQTYVVFDPVNVVCTQVPLVTDPKLPEDQKLSIFENARTNAINLLSLALRPNLPADESVVGNQFNTACPADATTGSVPPDCIEFKRNADRINALFGLLQTKTADQATVKTVQTLLATLTIFAPLNPTVFPPVSQGPNHKLTIKLNSQEQIGNTTTTLATVVITWQQTNWSLSTGVVLSTLKNKTFANSPIYNPDGSPDIDSTGKVKTQVTVSKTYPGIISPVFLVNYRWHNFQGNQGRFALLFSGGLGLNPVTKSADFAVGPSLQWSSVIFGTVLHYGRQTELTSGVHVGDQLGTSPPSLPTDNAYKPAFGISITYRLPLP